MTKTDLPDDPSSNEMAETRTEWAEDRTLLANERTFAGWMRTGMACIGLALGMKAVFKDAAYPLLAKGVAEIFIVAAIAIFWSALVKSHRAQRRLSDHDVEAQPHQGMTVLAALLTVAAVVTGITLWLL